MQKCTFGKWIKWAIKTVKAILTKGLKKDFING